MFVADYVEHKVWKINVKTKKMTVYAQNSKMNQPNDLAIAADGKLTLIQNAPAEVKIPRGFAISPDGGWLVAAGQDSNSIASHKIDPTTGKLTPAAKANGVGAPVCVIFAAAK